MKRLLSRALLGLAAAYAVACLALCATHPSDRFRARDVAATSRDDWPERFSRFATEAARRLGRDVGLWCTLNEPNVQMFFGYVEGTWPPGLRSKQQAVRAFAGALRAHAAAAAALRREAPGSQIGMAINLVAFEPRRTYLLTDWIATWQAARAFDWAFYDSIRAGRLRFDPPGFPGLDEPLPALSGSVDFLGVNYYRRELVGFSPGQPGLVAYEPGDGPLSDAGAEVYPEGLLALLREAQARYGLPVYVTENGIADARGALRPEYVRAHAHALARALREGIKVRGYFHWSLLDNFEWSEGFAPRFGLYRVDYATFERRPAPGAEVFAALAPRPRR